MAHRQPPPEGPTQPQGRPWSLYKALNGKPIELEPMVAGMLHAFIEADRGFQAWRKADAAPKPEPASKPQGG